MALEAKNAAWDVEREIDRALPSSAPGGASGARADFLANLGRRGTELSSMLAALGREPGSVRLRDDLRRRLHALGAGARLLRFERLATEVAAAEELLGEVAEHGELAPVDATALRAAFDCIPALGWAANETSHPDGERAAPPSPAAPAPTPAAPAAPRPWPLSVLVVGPKPIADALVLPTAEGAPAIDVERTEDGLHAIDLARAVAPDVVVVDADQRGARELIEAVRKDPLTAAVAIIALGTWTRPEDAAAFLGAGATRAVHKPVSPDALRRVCREASADHDDSGPSEAIGQVSLHELAARLGKEVERAIIDGAAAPNGEARVDLGRGDDVLGAVWSAAARVRDVVTIKSRGEIRFATGTAERAVPVGAWMNEPGPAGAATPTRRGGVRSATTAARALSGARVLVADDDPAVAWFLSGVLRAEGAVVSEACDGAVALRKAMEASPDVVLSDVLMPHLDGLTLTETMRRDPLLADVPVVLLSWKDDLLQRARELGARADAYLRKDASGATVVERVRELLYPRARLAERIAAGGEVHGRVDGFTLRSLLALVCAHRPSCVVEVRDAAYLYEIELAGGQPAQVTRTAKNGTFVRGAAAFAPLLGVRAGRFLVAPERAQQASRPAELSGSLADQIRPHAAASRGAVRLLTGPALVTVARLAFDDDWLTGYGALAPEPARLLLRRLTLGEAPRKLLAAGLTSARLFEEVVRDAAARGAITAVLGARGDDLLPAAIATELATLSGLRPENIAPPPNLDPATSASSVGAIGNGAGSAGNGAGFIGNGAGSIGNRMDSTGNGAGSAGNGAGFAGNGAGSAGNGAGSAGNGAGSAGYWTGSAGNGAGSAGNGADFAGHWAGSSTGSSDSSAGAAGALPGAADPGARARAAGFNGGAADPNASGRPLALVRPSSAGAFADALGDDVSPSGVIVAPAILGAAMPTAASLLASTTAEDLVALGAPSALPPSVETDGSSPSVEIDLDPSAGVPPAQARPAPLLTLGSLTPPPSAPRIEPQAVRAPTIKLARGAAVAIDDEDDESPAPRRSRKSEARSSSKTPAAPAVKPNSRMGIWLMCAVAGIVFAVGARISQERRGAASGAAPAQPLATAAAPAAAPTGAPALAPSPPASVAPRVITVPGDTADDPLLPQEAPLRSDEKIPRGQGLLEVVVGPTDKVSIDGQPTVAGPVVKATLAPREKPYEIKVQLRDEERTRFALIREGKRTRVRIAPPWNR